MKLKHHDLIVDENQPFLNCKLGREKYANVLTSIVENYADGFVLAINNEWGTGKTTFVKMWQQHLEIKEFETLYFNAWENDFEDNPMVAIMAELKSLLPKNKEATFNSLLKKGAILVKNVLPAIAKGVAKKYIDSETLVEGIAESAKAATEILKEEIDNHVSKKKGLIEFREELQKFVAANSNSKPLIFIIDELDRCRPDYAVKVLEHVKHFFGVSGIVFVLSIDKIQLENAVRGFYGSEGINANEYLKRFIDLEYKIPPPVPKTICNYFYDYFGLQEFFTSIERERITDFRYDGSSFIDFTSIIISSYNLTLRQQEKLFAQSRLILRQFTSNEYVFPSLFFLLIFLKDYKNKMYSELIERKLSLQEFVQKVEEIFSKLITPDNTTGMIFTESLFLLFYFNYYREINHGVKLIDDDANNIEILTVKSSIDGNAILERLVQFRRQNYERLSLEHFLKRINVTENLI